MLLLMTFAWLTANVHSAVAHCICAEACHEAHSEGPENGPATRPSVSEGTPCGDGGFFIGSNAPQSGASREAQGRGCCDSPDSNICLDHTQELVTAPVSYGSSSWLLAQSLSQFVHIHGCLLRALISAEEQDPAHARNSARFPAADDTRTFGWSHLVHTALPVRGPSILA